MNGMDSRTLVPPVIPPHPSLTHGNWLAGFPLRSFLELGAYRNAAGSARGHARNVLAEWGLGQFTDAVVLLVSEMITNSVAATEKGVFELNRAQYAVRLRCVIDRGTRRQPERNLVAGDS